jgi:hypothetical protein
MGEDLDCVRDDTGLYISLWKGATKRGDVLWDAVTLIKTSPSFGLGMGLVTRVADFPISVTKIAFWVAIVPKLVYFSEVIAMCMSSNC